VSIIILNIADFQFMLKAMQTGRCDDADAFDRKVFVFDMEPGPCPISWREMFAMARFKLQELVS